MNQFRVCYSPKETMPKRLELRAKELGLTTEQLIKRFIAEGMGGYGLSEVENVKATSFNEFCKQAGIIKNTDSFD